MSRKLALAIAFATGIGVVAGAVAFMPGGAAGEGAKAHAGHDEAGHGDEDGHGEAKPAARGPNGGELFHADDLDVELVAPESADGRVPMSVYLSRAGRRIAADGQSRVSMSVRRASGETQVLAFSPRDGAFVSPTGIAEPHFFSATLEVEREGRTARFEYAKEEGLLALSAEQMTAAGIRLATAQARSLDTRVKLPGEIRFDEDRTAHLVPRTAGVVESVAVNLGQQVEKGQLLAVIASPQLSEQRSELAAAERRAELARTTHQREQQLWKEGISAEQDFLQARQALQEAEIAVANARQKLAAVGGAGQQAQGNRYELRAPFAGTVVEKHLVPGEVVSEASNAFTLSDLSQVWATFSLSPKDLGEARVGRAVKVISPELGSEVLGQVAYIGNLLGEQTRTATARAVLKNPEGAWRPGLFVSIELATASSQAGVTVPEQAVQSIEERPSVFVQVAEGFVAQPVSLGTRSDGFVEVTEGLAAGTAVAAEGSFILKSELGKGSADHAH